MISVLHDLNKVDDALKMALKAHAINPDHIETNFNLALCHVGTGEFPAAISIYEKLADLRPVMPSRSIICHGCTGLPLTMPTYRNCRPC